MDKLKELFAKHREIIMYIFIGGCTTVLNWVVYTPLAASGLNMTLCNCIAWAVSVIFAFFTNKLFVFESRDMRPAAVAKEAAMFVGSRVISGAVEIVLPELLFKVGLDAEIFGIKGAAAKLVTSVLIIILNYIFSKLIVFRKDKDKGNTD